MNHRKGWHALIGRESERLINVAITRTKGKFIHVSNTSFIRRHVYQGKILSQLVEHQEKQKQTVRTREIGSWIQNQHPRLHWIHALKLGPVFRDIELAHSSIVISLPGKAKLPDQWKEQLKNRKKAKLIVISEKQWEDLQPDRRVEINMSFPFVMVDYRLLWLGFPLEGTTGVQPPYIAARLHSERICEYLISQLKIE